MREDNKLKLNNNGSTFLFVVIALIFIGLLAALGLALTASSFKMKTVDYNSRQNFYETEEFTGRIYSEIGMNALGILGEAYTTTMGKLESGSISSENALNDYIKELYYKNMMVYLRVVASDAEADGYVASQKTSGTPITIAAGDAVISGNVLPLLKNMVKDPTDATAPVPNMEIKGSVVCDLYGAEDETGNKLPTITINDVHVQYVDAQSRYETNLTFDIVVRYPEWDFTFMNPVSTGTDIDTFLDYILISTDGIRFEGTSRNVYGSVGTGTSSIIADNNSTTNGLRVSPNSFINFEFASDHAEGHYKYEPLEIVVADNIVINSSSMNDSSMKVNDAGEVWCNSIILSKATIIESEDTKGSVFESDGAKLYIQDDLQLDGDYSTVDITGGWYQGYSYNSYNDYESQNYSSSIIINGNNASVNLASLGRLYVNGLAYLDFEDVANPYRTGESLSVKGNQDIYMVPDAYMGANFSNPVSPSATMTDADLQVISNNLLTKFFAADKLDSTNPFITRAYYLNGKRYVFFYLNFEKPTKQTEYVIQVLQEYTGPDDVRIAIRERAMKNLSDMKESGNILTINDITATYTSGALVTATGGSNEGSASASFNNTANALVQSVSLGDRYRLMKSLLMTLTNPDTVLSGYNAVPSKVFEWLHTNKPEKYPASTNAVDNYLLNNSMVDNIINTAKITQYVEGANGEWSRNHTKGKLTYARRTAGNTYEVGNYTGVLVVDGDVEVKGKVVGLVIATGSITVTGSGDLVANDEIVHSILSDEQSVPETETPGPRSDVFRAYPILNPSSAFGKSINQLNYTDVLYYDNWRRYEDTTTY